LIKNGAITTTANCDAAYVVGRLADTANAQARAVGYLRRHKREQNSLKNGDVQKPDAVSTIVVVVVVFVSPFRRVSSSS
jgi:hypothetical protein